jgi:saccharopine dehydrogenase (NAD+, L-lysine forming)
MTSALGIRREDKNIWEKRAPITPEHVKYLKDKFGINTIVQTSPIRVFSDKEYELVGANIDEDLSDSDIVFGIKEIPINHFKSGKTYIFFSHTVKGQKQNMPMLKKMMELGCNLIDYEKITDEKGRRLVFFGKYAGLAGMIDTLWAFGQRLKFKGIKTPFAEIKQTIHYSDLKDAKNHLKIVGQKIQKEGLSELIAPVVIGFVGYGNVSRGAQEILDCFPVKEIRPDQLEAIHENFSDKIIYKVVFKEEDMVEPISTESKFDLQEYYKKPFCIVQFLKDI